MTIIYEDLSMQAYLMDTDISMSLDENGYLKVGQMILISAETLNGSMKYLHVFLIIYSSI